jgi:hypothetical protein
MRSAGHCVNVLDEQACVNHSDVMETEHNPRFVQAVTLAVESDGLHALLEDAQRHDEPDTQLLAIGILRSLLEEWEDGAVPRARVEGLSWSEIAWRLNRTKQSVWAKHNTD